MAFGAKTKEEILKELFPGKTEAELKAMVDSFDTLKAKADKATQLETDLATSNTELANTRVKLQELEGRNGNNNNNSNNNNNNNNNNQNERPRWDEDADAAFNDRVTPILGQNLQFQADMVYERVTEKLQATEPLFAKLKAEFDEELKNSPLTARANKKYVENCFNVVYGRHREEIRRDQLAGSGTFFVETGRNQAGGNNNNNNQNDATKILSEEEKREARKFGLTDEQWLKTRNAIKFVGGGVLQTEMR